MELIATEKMINRLQEGWDNIRKSNQTNFEQARVS
jgi:hypothetical protein